MPTAHMQGQLHRVEDVPAPAIRASSGRRDVPAAQQCWGFLPALNVWLAQDAEGAAEGRCAPSRGSARSGPCRKLRLQKHTPCTSGNQGPGASLQATMSLLEAPIAFGNGARVDYSEWMTFSHRRRVAGGGAGGDGGVFFSQHAVNNSMWVAVIQSRLTVGPSQQHRGEILPAGQAGCQVTSDGRGCSMQPALALQQPHIVYGHGKRRHKRRSGP